MAVNPNAFDALPGGGFVLSGSEGPKAPSGQIFGPDGRSRRRFPLGTRLKHLIADRRAGFWTGYADEGVYSGDRVSAGGLVRWDGRGNHAGALHPPAPHHHVAEAGTINVSGSTVHATYWPGAPLVETGPRGIVRIRDLPVADPFALAIRDDRMLLLGGHERDSGTAARADAVHHLRLTEDGAVVIGRETLVFPNGDAVRRYARPVCRGPHVFLDTLRTLRQWWVLTSP
ncbi:hypothetical protein ACFY8C_27235 [Streptomyces flavochromogenes]|uniref:Uncharacterized protein n=1 Tax=Streptomyces flavochromogenes TaxID=68199 RepID=A0ABW6XWW6_9ACTN